MQSVLQFMDHFTDRMTTLAAQHHHVGTVREVCTEKVVLVDRPQIVDRPVPLLVPTPQPFVVPSPFPVPVPFQVQGPSNTYHVTNANATIPQLLHCPLLPTRKLPGFATADSLPCSALDQSPR